MAIVLDVKSLSKKYPKAEKFAAEDVSFQIEEGDIFALIGPNGAGKTTTIRMIATLLNATSGDAEVDGHSIITAPDKVRECITYLPDEAGAYKTMTGRKYLDFMARLFTDNDEIVKKYISKAEIICGLGDRLDDKIGSYSRGMIRKLLLARSVMTSPKLAILDEPTSGLDVINALEIRKTIKSLAEQGMSFLLSSHNMLEIEFVSTKVGIITKGHLMVVGKPSELKEKYGCENLEEVFEKVVKENEIH
ncbi:MAG: ABC transporter ATP-binding protein [Ruminococcus sp.]|nr:ABC transporter ATP-binding protein [Ruminococcus sp.]